MTSDKTKNLELSGVSSRDFDGHTAFLEMSAEERLLWLSHAAAFVEEIKQINSTETSESSLNDKINK